MRSALMKPSRAVLPDANGGVSSGIKANEFAVYATANDAPIAVTTAVVDTPSIDWATRIGSLLILTSGTITWAGAGQATVQLYASRIPQAALTGAATGLPVTASAAQLVGSPANWGPAGVTTLNNQGWWFSASKLAELQSEWPYIGVELIFPAAPSQGSVAVYLYGASD